MGKRANSGPWSDILAHSEGSENVGIFMLGFLKAHGVGGTREGWDTWRNDSV